MFRFDDSARMTHPAGLVWSVLIDFPGVPRWEDGVREVRQVSPGPIGLGTFFAVRRVYGGREAAVEGRIIDWQDGRSATMEIAGGPVRSARVTYAVEPLDDEACLVRYVAEGELAPPMGWLGPLIAVVGRRQVRANLARLDRLVREASDGGVEGARRPARRRAP